MKKYHSILKRILSDFYFEKHYFFKWGLILFHGDGGRVILWLICIIIYTIVLLKKKIDIDWKIDIMKSYLKQTIYIENLKCAKFVNVHSKMFTEEITLKLLVLICDIHMFRLGTNNCDVIDLFYKTKSLPLIEKKFTKKSGNYLILMKFSVFIYQWMNFIMQVIVFKIFYFFRSLNLFLGHKISMRLYIIEINLCINRRSE